MKEKNENYFFGSKLKEYRLKNNMTQEQVAQLIGVDPKYISQIELGKNKCSLKLLIKFCNVFDVTPNEVLYELVNSLKSKSDLDELNNNFSKLSKRDKKLILELINKMLKI